MTEHYQKVAYIAFDNKDGSIMINVPLYVKVSELNKNGMTQNQEDLIHRITEIMIKRYEKQLSEFMSEKKEEQLKNESNTLPRGM